MGRGLLIAGVLTLLVAQPATGRAKTARCKVSNGAVPARFVSLAVKLPPGFALRSNSKQCLLFKGSAPQSADVLINLMAVHQRDAGAEQLLNVKPDGAKKWFRKINGARNATGARQGTVKVEGRKWPYYTLQGRVMGQPGRTAIVCRVQKKRHNVVLILVAKPSHAPRAAALFRSVARTLQVTVH
ncbi:MAG: hypothetical protein ABI333_09110 [bacterium]